MTTSAPPPQLLAKLASAERALRGLRLSNVPDKRAVEAVRAGAKRLAQLETSFARGLSRLKP